MNQASLCSAGLSLSLAVCGGSLAACGGPSGAGASQGAKGATKLEGSASSASKGASKGTSPSTTSEPTSGATGDAKAPPTPAPAPKESPFHVAVATDGETDLRTVGDGLYVMAGNFVGEVTPSGVKPVVEQERDDDKMLLWGLPSYGRAVDLGGTRADSPLLVFLTDNGRVGYNLVYQRKGGAWKQTKMTGNGLGYVGMSAWKDGRTLGLLVGIGLSPMYQAAELTVIGGPPAATPKLTAGAAPCPTRVSPMALKAFASGEVFTVGPPCEPSKENDSIEPTLKDSLVVERWAAGQTKGQLDELPLREGSIVFSSDMSGLGFAGASPSDVYLNLGEASKEPRLFHFDGKAWAAAEVPSKSELIRSITPGPDGSMFAVAGDLVYKKAAGKGWEELALPAEGGPFSPIQVVSQPNGAVWLSAEVGREGALLTTGAPPARVEKVSAGAGKQAKYVLPKAATSKCTTNFAMLYAFTKVTPENYDFPLTRQAVKGKKRFKDARFIVVEENGRRYFGAMAPSFALGKALVEEIEKEVKGAKPALLCYEPKVVRELKLNIDTGEVIP